MKKRVAFLAILLLALLSTGVAQADILFSNFGAGDAFLTGAGALVGALGTTSNEPAMGFMPNATAQLDSIDFVTSLDKGANIVILSLVMNDQGVPLGSTLESWIFTDEMGTFNTAAPILTADSINHPILTVGILYWLTASAPVETTAVWNSNSINGTGPISSSQDGGDTWSAATDNIQGVFRVNGTAVPEPSTVLLLGAGLAGVGIMRRKFKK